MRVLHIETGRHLYGGARQAGYLVDGLSRRGIDSPLVCAPGHALGREDPGRRLIALTSSGDRDLACFRRLREIIRAEAPDIVHVHSRRGADLYGGRAARAEGVPAVLTRRVESREPAAWIRFKCAPYAAVVAISRAVRAELADRAGVDDRRLWLIPSACDTERFRPDDAARTRLLERFGLAPDAFVAASAAQLIPRKGQDFLLELAARVRGQLPGLQLLLFGRGRDRGPLERQARRLGLKDTVRFPGFDERWPELVPGIDLLLHPARREGLGVAVLEAMAAGVPVLASAVGGLVDIIETGVNGLLLPPDTPGAWQSAMLELAADRAGRERLGAAARRSVSEAFTIARMTDRYIELYGHVAG